MCLKYGFLLTLETVCIKKGSNQFFSETFFAYFITISSRTYIKNKSQMKVFNQKYQLEILFEGRFYADHYLIFRVDDNIFNT